MNQFIVQRVLGARDIWHARMGMVMAGYAKLFLPLIIVLPGLILFSRHPEFMLGNWADANHRADGGFVVLVREFFPAGPARASAGGADLRRPVHGQFGGQCHRRDPDAGHLCAADQPARPPKNRKSASASGPRWSRSSPASPWPSPSAGWMPASISICRPINALVAPPFAAILWVGLLWKRTNGAGAIAAIVAGLRHRHRLQDRGAISGSCRAGSIPSATSRRSASGVSILACVAGTLVHPAPTPGTEANPVTFWNSRRDPARRAGHTLVQQRGRCGPACRWC